MNIKIIKLPTATINKVAKAFGVTPEEYISMSRTISSGRSVCAHFKGTEANGTISVFSLS